MQASLSTHDGSPDVLPLAEVGKSALRGTDTPDAFAALKRGVQAALETYANVHRGSGHHSLVSTQLYEQAREIVLDYLGLSKDRYVALFCTPRRAEALKAHLKPGSYQCLSSQEVGLPLGLRVLAVSRQALPSGAPFQAGGGTARLVFPDRVIWAHAPDKFEAGTPAIVNLIALARALQLIRHWGPEALRPTAAEASTATDILRHDALEPYTGRALLEQLRQTLIGRGVPVPTVTGARPYINLDNGASTPTFAPIWDAVCRAWRQPPPVQQAIVREVKAICAEVLNAPAAAYDVLFTSNTTEAINLVAESLSQASRPGLQPVVINTLLEHNSNELPWRAVPGVELIRLPVDAEGFVNLQELEAHLRAHSQPSPKQAVLVAVSGASNVLGVFNPLAEIGRLAHHYGAHLLVDGAQLVAHRKVDMEGEGIDYLAFSAHKAYAPFGTGVLVVRQGLLHFSPAALDQIRASGEENVGGIAALGKALGLLQRIGLDVIQAEEQSLTGRALRGLAQIPGLTVYGIQGPASPHFAQKGGVIVFRLAGLYANQVAKELAERGGIGVRYGCHCAHLLVKHLLKIPAPQQLLQGVIVSTFPQLSLPGLTRVSLGLENSEAEIDTLLHVLGQIAQQPRAKEDPATTHSEPLHLSPAVVQQQLEASVQAAARRVYA